MYEAGKTDGLTVSKSNDPDILRILHKSAESPAESKVNEKRGQA